MCYRRPRPAGPADDDDTLAGALQCTHTDASLSNRTTLYQTIYPRRHGRCRRRRIRCDATHPAVWEMTYCLTCILASSPSMSPLREPRRRFQVQ
mmetsp:Transcript_26976/g.89779  ORF Transcript_26976/g.89779 Transcript_26976/m.89779 type:complete len:94 (-) Transcript_26976:180-461(-)